MARLASPLKTMSESRDDRSKTDVFVDIGSLIQRVRNVTVFTAGD